MRFRDLRDTPVFLPTAAERPDLSRVKHILIFSTRNPESVWKTDIANNRIAAIVGITVTRSKKDTSVFLATATERPDLSRVKHVLTFSTRNPESVWKIDIANNRIDAIVGITVSRSRKGLCKIKLLHKFRQKVQKPPICTKSC